MRSTKSMSVVLLLLVVLWYFMAIPAFPEDPWDVNLVDEEYSVNDGPGDTKDSGTGDNEPEGDYSDDGGGIVTSDGPTSEMTPIVKYSLDFARFFVKSNLLK